MRRSSTLDAIHGLWVRPNFSLNNNRREISWTGCNERSGDSPRLLELADIALGNNKPQKKTRLTPMHDTKKTEPYNQK
jgi:hypothetical protein